MKTRKQEVRDEIINILQEDYFVSDRELESGSLIYRDAFVLPDEVAPKLARKYGVKLKKKREYGSWKEFVDALSDAILTKK